MKIVGIKVDLVGNNKKSAKDVFDRLDTIGYKNSSDVKTKILNKKIHIFVSLRCSYKEKDYWLDIAAYSGLDRYVDLDELDLEILFSEISKISELDEACILELEE